MVRERHFIDTFKLATGPVVLGLMAAFGEWDNPTAWQYLGLHGTYGVLWVLKSRIFGDKSWERPVTVKRAFILCSGLSAYWAAPLVITLREVRAPPWLMAAAAASFGLGVFLHFASDMQKWLWLQLRSGQLLTTGLWARTRNPNYLGELFIYSSFSALAMHPIPVALFALIIAIEWVPNIVRKERSLARYPAFAEWKARSGVLFPRLF